MNVSKQRLIQLFQSWEKRQEGYEDIVSWENRSPEWAVECAEYLLRLDKDVSR